MTDRSFDLETFLFAAGRLDPDIVCATFCDESFQPELHHVKETAHDCLEYALKNDRLITANGAYDFACVIRQWPDLMPLVFQAYFEDRVLCVQIQQKLIDLSRGQLFGYRDHQGTYVKRFYSLAALHAEYGFGELAKVDTWRLRYSELYNVPSKDWPAEARQYALDDASATLRVYRAQQQYSEVLGDSCAQARAHFSLQLMSCRGVVTDARACDAFLEQTKIDIENARKLLEVEGIVRPNGSKDTKKAKARMESVCLENEVPLKKTATDGVCLDAEACRESGDQVLMAYSTYTNSKTILEKAALIKLGSTGIPLQTSFEVLLENGRTSSREPGKPLVGMNLQNLPRKGKLRECVIPREGFYLCSVDFNSAELFCFSQVELWATGKSVLAEALNSGQDVHCRLGATLLGCEYEEVLANKKTGKYAWARQIAKAGNFGFLGGLGPKKFMLTVNRSAESKDQRIDLATATQVHRAWKKTWATDEYFEWVKSMLSDNGRGFGTIKQYVSGRVRAQVDYSALANTFFSGLAADAAKACLLPVAYESYVDRNSALFGTRPLLFLHDEILAEVPIATAHEAAFRLRDLMLECTRKYTPDVPMKATPALATRWIKSMDERYDASGRLIPWEPESKSAKAPARSALLSSLMEGV